MSTEESVNRVGTDTPRGELGTGRAARSLGRGLDEISHLFLSNSTGGEAGPPDSTASPRLPIPSVRRAGVAVLRPGAPLMKEQLTATLRECHCALEEGMQAVAAGLSCGPYGDIDLLGLDRAHHITLIDLETTPSDGLLMRGIAHVDWVVRNLSTVQRLCEGWTIDRERPPRLMLVAPRFSPLLKSAIRQIANPAIACFTYREIELGSGTGIFIDRAGDND